MENKTNAIETWSRSKIIGEETWEITLFEHSEMGRSDLVVPHKHDFYLIFFVEHGTGVHEIDFNRVGVQPCQIHFLRPQQVHYWKLSEETIGHQLMFSTGAIQLMSHLSSLPFFQLDVPAVLEVDPTAYHVIQLELIKLQQLLPNDSPVGKELSILQFFLLLKTIQLHYVKAFPSVEMQTKDLKIQAFKTLLEQHFKTQNQVSFYADKLNITPNYLNIRAKKVMGVSASHSIQQRIILEAERLLITTDRSIKEIAYELGFQDTGYFTHYFKKWQHKTPGEFRKSYNMYNKVT